MLLPLSISAQLPVSRFSYRASGWSFGWMDDFGNCPCQQFI